MLSAEMFVIAWKQYSFLMAADPVGVKGSTKRLALHYNLLSKYITIAEMRQNQSLLSLLLRKT